MAVAVAKAVEDGATGGRLRVDRQHRRVGRRLRGARGPDGGRPLPGRARSPPRSSPSRAPSARRCSRCAGSFDEALRSCLELVERGTFALVNSLNPHRIEGQKTAAFEIDEELGRAPDVLALPYGGGGNTDRVREGLRRGRASRPGSSPPRRPSARDARLGDPDRRAGARRRGRRARRRRARVELVTVTDEEITDSWLELAQPRGRLLRAVVGRRPGGARAASRSSPGSTVVCVLTGHGLKDTAAVDVLTAPAVARRPERRGDPRGGRLVTGDVVVRAPASTANLGPGFDCAAAALDLWNELDVAAAVNGEPLVVLEGEGADELPRDDTAPRAARVRARRAARGPPLPLRQPDPARARARLVRRDRRGRARRRRSPRRTHASPRRAARARPAARGPRRQPRGRALRRRLPDLAERRARPRPPARRPTCRSRRSSSSRTRA